MGCCEPASEKTKNPDQPLPVATGCCGGGTDSAEQASPQAGETSGGGGGGVYEKVRAGYATIAETGSLAAVTGGCCGGNRHGEAMGNDELAAQLGYTPEQLEALPEGANMGLSCGNPTALAGLVAGQTVVDLGSGGGFDCFLAGPRVGATGRVIGVDMTPAMLTKARGNAAHYQKTSGLENVEFRLGEIEHLPVADASVDVILSNCVINLSPDKPQVWREIARVLQPGGRVVASDIVLLRPLPEAVVEMVEALVGCVAGAVGADDYRSMMGAVGLTDIVLTPKADYVAALERFADPLYVKIAAALPKGTKVADYVASMDITAAKPGACCCGGGAC